MMNSADVFEALTCDETTGQQRAGGVLRTVSVMMPLYNEAAWVERSLAAVLSQDYPAVLTEVLIADSGSDDGTPEYIRSVINSKPDQRIRLLENVDRTPGAALNRMIREATGEILVRVDGHTEVAPDYVRWSVAALESTEALNVGGYVSAAGEGLVGRAIAIAINSFWGNGGARFRGQPLGRPVYVDTVAFGAWRRETFVRLGMFAEGWRANEDCEYNSRILDAGGRILLHPAIRATYFARRSLGSLARQYFRYGKLKCRVIALHPRRVRARQLAPPFLVILLGSLIWAATIPGARTPLLLIPPLAYLSTIAIASTRLALGAGLPACALVLPGVIATLHLSYGIGVVLGAVQLVFASVRSILRRGVPLRVTGL